MPKSLKTTLGLTGFFWILFLSGVFATYWCDFPGAANLVLFTGPLVLIGSVSSFVEWRVWKADD